ncbi:MAG: DUF167 domain-containing protein [Candidatus Sericytochromatia bacterium]
MSYYQEKSDGLTVHVRVQPRASRNQLDGVVGDRLRLRLTAPPVEGEANQACVIFLAGLFGVPKSQVTLVAGQKAREKSLHVLGDASKLLSVLNEALA